ncbi:MAG: hypothetical protein IKJ05_06165 [Oscillospiraceae bacterium]|nr:hypothetical protein [Oscillospiraceae bacterium]
MNNTGLSKKDKIFFLVLILLLIVMVPAGIYGYFWGGYIGESQIGTPVNNRYYYEILGKGVYEYIPGGESHRLMKTVGVHNFSDITDSGVYLQKGKKIYFYDFETQHQSIYFDGRKSDCSHLRFEAMTDGNINIVLYDKDNQTARQMILADRTGEIIVPLSDSESYNTFYRYSQTDFYIGKRHIAKKPITDASGNTHWILEENGKNILPENMFTDEFSGSKSDDCLVFELYSKNYDKQMGLLLIRAGSKDETINIPYHYQYNIFGDYAYSISNYQYSELQCINIHTGESWILNDKTDITADEIVTDGSYIYARGHHDKSQRCWEIIKDETGKPIKAVSVTDKI